MFLDDTFDLIWQVTLCNVQLGFGIPPGVLQYAWRAIHQLRLRQLTSTALY